MRKVPDLRPFTTIAGRATWIFHRVRRRECRAESWIGRAGVVAHRTDPCIPISVTDRKPKWSATGPPQDRRLASKVSRRTDVRDATTINDGGRRTAWVRRREWKAATWLSRADLGARKTSRCLLVRLADREDRRTGTDRQWIRRPDRSGRRHGVLGDLPSITDGGRRIAWGPRREERDATWLSRADLGAN